MKVIDKKCLICDKVFFTTPTETDRGCGKYCSRECLYSSMRKKDIPHGTPGGYTNHKCRCDACKTSWSAYHKPRLQQIRLRELPKECCKEGCSRVSKFTSARKGMCYRHYRFYLKTQ